MISWIGGLGEDIPVGNLNKDTMSGGGGSDTPVSMPGDGCDTVTDAEFGEGGDVFLIGGNTNVQSFADLNILQDDLDARGQYGDNPTIIFQDTDMVAINAVNLEFDPFGAAAGPLWQGSDLVTLVWPAKDRPTNRQSRSRAVIDVLARVRSSTCLTMTAQ